ncbi:MAG: M57 family metalloprotease [Polyangiaceae bacterium]
MGSTFAAIGVSAVVSVSFGVAGCAYGSGSEGDEAPSIGTRGDLGITFEQFEARAFREPETGIYIVDGDTPVLDVKLLHEFYDRLERPGALIVDRQGGVDSKWTDTQKTNISYCVSSRFNANKARVVQAMADATGAWEAAANVKFVYASAQDSNCTSTNSNVVFDVNPVNVNGQYLARAFFPNQGRATRNVLIDNTAFDTTGEISLVGVLRHELGHTIGFRHEHTRPEAGTCFEDNAWRALTTYDSASVMHYPQCNGTNTWELLLTAKDKTGAASLYGAPAGATDGGTTPPVDGGTTDPVDAGTPPTDGGTTNPGTRTTETGSGSLAKNATRTFGPFAAVPGSVFDAVMSGTNDADLYVRFGAAPTTTSFDCRPYTSGSAEECHLDVPSTKPNVYVMVRGYTASTFSLSMEYSKP